MINVADRIPTGRNIDKILRFHEISPHSLEDKVIYDLGCGTSDLEADLALEGIKATVIGFDMNPSSLEPSGRSGSNMCRLQARLDNLPVADQSGQVIIASYSFPLQGETPEEITDFYAESKRVTAIGGLLLIHPIAAGTLFADPALHHARSQAAKQGAADIRQSTDWLNYSTHPDVITSRRLG